ncbi:Copia protein, partial [Mucuna pruriens]
MWIFRNKLDENGKERIDFTKTFAHVARLEVICILLSFIAHHNMILHQINVKCTFLKALYRLKQALHVWYEKLSLFLMSNDFQRGKVYTTLFRKNYDSNFIIMQIYIDDIIFCATDDSLCGEFSELMQKEFKMTMMGELKFFHGLQIKRVEDGIYIHQTKYAM